VLSVVVSVAVLSCGNRRLGEELWLMPCVQRDDRDRMLKFRFGA
jgi:hypothetical protein